MVPESPIISKNSVRQRQRGEVLVARVNILGVEVDDISEKQAISEVLKLAKDTRKSHYVVTVNSEFVMLARRNPEFLEILANADLAVPDGTGVIISKLILGGKHQNRITGVDLLEKLCSKSAKLGLRIGFLGGFSDVAGKVAERQIAQNPGLRVVFVEPGDPTISHDLRLKQALDAVGRVDILFVAFGMGQQEFWIKRNKNRLNVGVLIGVGGAFDYISQVKKRAPKLLQDVGFEWLWRLFWEPTRLWRMRVLPTFFLLVGLKFFTAKNKPINRRL